MTRRWLLIGLPLLLLGAVLAMVLGDLWPSETTTPRPQASPDAPGVVTPVPPTVAADPIDAAASRTSGEPAPDQPIIPADAVWVMVLVVDQRTQEPVASVEVAWMDGTVLQRLESLPPEERMYAQHDQERLARTSGWRTRTDQAGKARIHLGIDRTTVFARHGSRYGSAFCNQNDVPTELRIELRDDHTLVVMVLDHQDQPAASLPVAIARRAEGKLLRWWPGGWLPPTGDDGLTRLIHVQELRFDDRPDPPGVAAQWHACIWIPGLRDTAVPFDPKALPEGRLVLRLPPTGSLLARVTCRGQPLTVRAMGLNVAGLTPAEANNTGWHKAPDAQGRFHFDWLPLGRDWLAMVQVHGTATIPKQCAGPTVPGQQVQVDIEVPDDQVVLAGRCLDSQGRPLVKESITADFALGGGNGSTTVSTDPDGRFLWISSLRKAARLERFQFRLAWSNAVAVTARLTPRDLTPGVNDVGDVVLTAGPLVVSGRLLVATGSKRVDFQVERIENDAWRRVEEFTTSHLGEGRFEVHGETTAVRHRLSFAAFDHLPLAPVEFMPGAKDLEIGIVRGSGLPATVLMAPTLPRGIEAELRPQGERWPVADRRGHDRYLTEPWHVAGEQHRLGWRSLPPGAYTLAFRVRGLAEALLSIADVQVPPPAAGDDRLRDIDLRGLVTVLVVRVLDPQGKPFAPGRAETTAFVQPQDPASIWQAFGFSKDELRMPAPTRPIDLLVVRTGLPPKLVSAAQGEVEVRLDAWPELEIVVPGLPTLPEGFALSASVQSVEPQPQGGSEDNFKGSVSARSRFSRPPPATVVVKEGRASLPIGQGRHRLTLQLVRTNGPGMELSVSPTEVVHGSVPLEIRTSSEQIQQAIAQLQAPQGK